MRNISLGFGVAFLIALMMAIPQVGGISTWKIVLGAIGVVMVLLAGRDETR